MQALSCPQCEARTVSRWSMLVAAIGLGSTCPACHARLTAPNWAKRHVIVFFVLGLFMGVAEQVKLRSKYGYAAALLVWALAGGVVWMFARPRLAKPMKESLIAMATLILMCVLVAALLRYQAQF
ncbi:MAG: hypothetical protein V4582_04640 [Pseudomonadota bacterium]